MKIVFLSGLYPPYTKGGGEISTYLIAEGLKARGHDVQVITEENSRLGLLKKPLFERRHARQVARRVLPLLHPRTASVRNFPSGARRAPVASPVSAGYDIIHAHDFRSALALSELNLPNAVVTVRDYAPICGTTNNILADGSRCHCTWHDVLRTKRFREVGFPRNYARAWQYWHNVPYRKETFRRLKRQIFISGAQQKETAEQFDFSGIETTVIYNPVSEEYLSMPIQEGRKGSVLYVGRVEDYKGVRLLLTAWKEVVKDFPGASLTIVGEGAQKVEYERWAEKNGVAMSVAFKGRVSYEQLRGEYDAARVIVAPHVWTEPFGRTVAEAMSRGKVVVAANSGGPAEIIQNNKTGLLFHRNDVSALTQQLKLALQMSESQMAEIGRKAQTWVQENLTQENIARQCEEFYHTILSQ